MNRYQCECCYCGHTWLESFYYKSEAEDTTCPRCKDGNIKMKDANTSDVFGYEKQKEGEE